MSPDVAFFYYIGLAAGWIFGIALDVALIAGPVYLMAIVTEKFIERFELRGEEETAKRSERLRPY